MVPLVVTRTLLHIEIAGHDTIKLREETLGLNPSGGQRGKLGFNPEELVDLYLE